MDNPTDHDFRPMPHNPQFCTFFGCMKNQSQHADAVDRGSLSLGQLDGHGLARLREVVLGVIDDGRLCELETCTLRHPWRCFEFHVPERPDEINQRLDFCDEIQRRIAEEAK